MKTKRLILDHLKASDKQAYFDNISHDKEVLKTFMCKYCESIDDLNFVRYINNDDIFAIRLKENNKVIGVITIYKNSGDICEIGYAIGSRYWGNGYTTEAAKEFIKYCFNKRGFKQVNASYFVGNDASKRVMEKCGMKYDRFVENELEYLGESKSLHYYLLSKLDFDKRK